jgi:hypothetical protein
MYCLFFVFCWWVKLHISCEGSPPYNMLGGTSERICKRKQSCVWNVQLYSSAENEKETVHIEILIVFGPRGVAVGHVLGQSAIFTQLYLFISWTHIDYLNINIYSWVWAKWTKKRDSTYIIQNQIRKRNWESGIQPTCSDILTQWWIR